MNILKEASLKTEKSGTFMYLGHAKKRDILCHRWFRCVCCNCNSLPDLLYHRFDLATGIPHITHSESFIYAVHWLSTAEQKLVLAAIHEPLSEPQLANSLGAQERLCGLSRLDQKQSSQTPIDPISAHAVDAKEKVTGCQSNSPLTHGSIYYVLIHKPDRSTRVDY